MSIPVEYWVIVNKSLSIKVSIDILEQCSPTKTSDNCCSTGNYKCKEGQGDCDSDSDCEGDLVCGTNNCQKYGFLNADYDCCAPAGRVI